MTSDDTPGEPTDDPDTPNDDDPTTTPLGTPSQLELFKRDSLQIDADVSTGVSVGDTLRYTVDLTNPGLSDLTSVVFNDTPDSFTSLVAGSVTTTQGTVTTGNTGGDTTVSVDVGTVTSTTTVAMTFDVLINAAPPSGVLANQGVASSNELPDEPSDDPDTAGEDDPTETPLEGTTVLDSFKTDFQVVDVAGDGALNAGDTLRYVITVMHSGDTDATGVVPHRHPRCSPAHWLQVA